MPPLTLETKRLRIRPFRAEELATIHRILDQTFGDGGQIDDVDALAERHSWLQWQMLSAEWLPKIYQPPYGDLAVALKETDALIGAAGFTPCLGPYDQIPELRLGTAGDPASLGRFYAEVGLFWAIDPDHQRRGYASEAGRALVDHAFAEMNLRRIIATTEYDNHASQAVMRKIGMTLTRNPQTDPPWLQVVGFLDTIE